MIIAATGHRPPKLGGYGESARRRLIDLATSYLHTARPDVVISGMALGWDQAFAEAADRLGLAFVATIPFEGQERRWPAASQRAYARLLGRAHQVQIVSEFPGHKAMQIRNEWMVDQADRMCAMWDGSWGGTFNCIQYAQKVGRPVDNLWKQWAYDLSELLR